jgi:hypothetical protein
MSKAFYPFVFLALLVFSSAALAQSSYPIVEPGAASMEITRFVADAKPDEAVAAVENSMPQLPSKQLNLDQLRSALKFITQNGQADFTGDVSSKTYGNSVQIITHYLHFPRADLVVNQFMFLRYTFMKGKDGWMLTSFDFKTAGKYPPPDWSE